MLDFGTYLGGCYIKQPYSNLQIHFRIRVNFGEGFAFTEIDPSPKSVKGLPLTSLIFDDIHRYIHINLVAHGVYLITPVVL